MSKGEEASFSGAELAVCHPLQVRLASLAPLEDQGPLEALAAQVPPFENIYWSEDLEQSSIYCTMPIPLVRNRSRNGSRNGSKLICAVQVSPASLAPPEQLAAQVAPAAPVRAAA